jgi:hypothetical protein
MNDLQVQILVFPDGRVLVKVIGAQGNECLTLTKELEDALGVVIHRQRVAGGAVEMEGVKSEHAAA